MDEDVKRTSQQANIELYLSLILAGVQARLTPPRLLAVAYAPARRAPRLLERPATRVG